MLAQQDAGSIQNSSPSPPYGAASQSPTREYPFLSSHDVPHLPVDPI